MSYDREIALLQSLESHSAHAARDTYLTRQMLIIERSKKFYAHRFRPRLKQLPSMANQGTDPFV